VKYKSDDVCKKFWVDLYIVLTDFYCNLFDSQIGCKQLSSSLLHSLNVHAHDD
jgi:hypothetical protein